MTLPRLRRAIGASTLALGASFLMGSGPIPDREGVGQAPGAARMGEGTVFVTEQELTAPEGGKLYFSLGTVHEALRQPQGSCRLEFSGTLPKGAELHVARTSYTDSGREDSGISSVTFHFRDVDAARQLHCDTVGSNGPGRGEVLAETAGILRIEPEADDHTGVGAETGPAAGTVANE